MELPILNLQAQEIGRMKLPPQLKEPFRPDLIKRAFEAGRANARQPYGTDPRAGKRASAKLSRRRRKYKSGYGRGISRVPRKTLLRRGMQFIWVGAFAPGTVGGRRAHPPKSEKLWLQKINKKERRKALRSALSASMNKEMVEKRGHIAPEKYPFIVSEDFEKLSKTKEVLKVLLNLGFEKELERSSRKKVRAGKGKLRGRRYKKASGPLIVVSEECPLMKAAKNIPGVEVALANRLNAMLLAPGSLAGRLLIFTKSALEKLEKEELYA